MTSTAKLYVISGILSIDLTSKEMNYHRIARLGKAENVRGTTVQPEIGEKYYEDISFKSVLRSST